MLTWVGKSVSNLSMSPKRTITQTPECQAISPILMKSEVEVNIIPRNVVLALKEVNQMLVGEGHSRSAKEMPGLKQSEIYVCGHR